MPKRLVPANMKPILPLRLASSGLIGSLVVCQELMADASCKGEDACILYQIWNQKIESGAKHVLNHQT